ncbi:MAG: hypothetical protein RMJ19_09090 [Gemmatales bacterium]|nr:hypothetical protein [Gemmatales bacterium]MDW8175815.1 hypothetical protein [Gemmatales bacterium]
MDSILSYAVEHIKDLAEALVFELIIPRYLAEYNGTFREQLVQHLQVDANGLLRKPSWEATVADSKELTAYQLLRIAGRVASIPSAIGRYK